MDYERIDFKTGQVLTADALNHMQDGIEAAIKRDDVTLAAYADLVSLRNEGKLKAGKFYRITDYMTTTAQFGTLSAGHPFDVIVLALSKDALAEEAYAVHSERDTEGYFANSNLSAWKIWYSLDNDTTKFAWADAENGKGVIYRMIDEFNNDIPYDFKNIMYEDKMGFWYFQWGSNYTFMRNESLDKQIDGVQYYGYTSDTTPSAWSNSNCLITDETPTMTSALYKEDGSAISYGGNITSVSLEEKICHTFTESDDLTGGSYGNEIKPYKKNVVLTLNKIIFGVHCYGNTFGDNCYSNTFENDCYSNTFGDDCYSNIFGSSCANNTFGNGCNNNTFGDNCRDNTFGNDCGSNTFGDECNSNTFGNSCRKNSFRMSMAENAPIINYCQYNHFDDGCSYIVIWSTRNPSGTNLIRNININRGVCGKSDAYNYIRIEKLNSEHEINVNQIDGIVSIGDILSIRYDTLKSLRNNGQLITGQQYRIIDYVTTTSQANTQSAGHQFDLIVTADDEKTLNEKARAIQHEGDTYFADSDINAWEVWYCLDNDTDRFAWAGVLETHKSVAKGIETFTFDKQISHVIFEGRYYPLTVGVKTMINSGPPTYVTLLEDGKSLQVDNTHGYIDAYRPLSIYFNKSAGVIYRMIDEFGNDCPYDFKNIQFKRKIDLSEGRPKISEDAEETWVYTFAATSHHIDNDEWSGLKDGSLESPYGHMSDEETSTFHHNVMKPRMLSFDSSDENRTNCGKAYLNNNVLLGYWDEIGSTNEEDVPYYYAYCCYDNTFGDNCHYNTFGSSCSMNTFGVNCFGNTFGDNCICNTFGDYCYDNTFGSDCGENSFRNDCHDNIFGDYCRDNTFGNKCSSNTCGRGFLKNVFGEECQRVKFIDANEALASCEYNRVDSGVANVTVQGSGGSNLRIQHIHICGGVKSKTIAPVASNANYEQCIARKSSGDVVIFCLADLKNS